MNTIHTALAKAAAITVLASIAGLAAAADSSSLTVTATVAAVCKFSSVPAISFNIDPSGTGVQSGTSSVTYRCTNGTTPSFGTGAGTLTGRTLTRALGGTMGYDLSVAAPSAGDGFSTAPEAVVLTAGVAQAAYQDAVAGAYVETLSLTISP